MLPINLRKDEIVSEKNDSLCACTSDVTSVIHRMFPAYVLVLGVLSSEGHVMSLHFFQQRFS